MVTAESIIATPLQEVEKIALILEQDDIEKLGDELDNIAVMIIRRAAVLHQLGRQLRGIGYNHEACVNHQNLVAGWVRSVLGYHEQRKDIIW